jgi:hypothetical protein
MTMMTDEMPRTDEPMMTDAAEPTPQEQEQPAEGGEGVEEPAIPGTEPGASGGDAGAEEDGGEDDAADAPGY